ncbi:MULTISPECIES: hydroxymethylglutaryl-CoA lyase [Stappiaceae]|jgi:hydroxymethylglutaryl-CoA lyase|uniref:Hydroxymethylglutaryl-CoA lyase YngG n=2 Tax=Roseibium TaxID=150830 RepID=A0A0M6Y7E9_9HYPH|nr:MULTISPECIES: hydroxymethylglutaryl-CoA lyase [Stappiaceae]MCR9285557.1 hydroxymethylglutaryl-CoA lyase [Paracoccaceae bacterium]MEC9405261.1 hydroxymethylglutaryl-CoA lyase [Pseudomonadota bacterium]AMN51589.1 hydroxymethylglutaryl-CoA lyase [Labrenzia sp. CP4]AQQ04645.1 hydroxymethylglutaryl-CoA lyase [Roseibium aggregatum]ERP87805.1 hydroxymethylglutaryl-CoA lyase [Labrenzia sp. C1B10]
MSEFVTLFEMGPRDGLQNEKTFVPTAQKIDLVDRLSACGFRKIEVTSFVSPKWVPQMADAQEVMEGIYRHPSVTYAVLTPNVKGYTAAKKVSADEVAIFGSASEGFSRKNINCSVAESIERFKPLLEKAHEDGIPVRGYVSCVTDCPYDGATPPEKVAEVAKTLFDLGCYEISLGDTIGAGTPETIGRMLDAVLTAIPADKLAGHFHDTKGRAIENIEVSLEKGLRTFDSAVGGLGGCPYAPGAKGNVATEAVLDLMTRKGFETGIDRAKLAEIADFARTLRSVDA